MSHFDYCLVLECSLTFFFNIEKNQNDILPLGNSLLLHALFLNKNELNFG